ncbi:uncharacterized protein N7496_009053 [Penicillium cataractarum]|uniref:Uncharacterized protein n=1 Tax=Penicillium cataractarum TaxID=2100454 RepID=A0A9W9V546_9EURO|nr:uncharacterized protein N7496_009053 [Penicillium cataractarum]KAJ5369293.1 hypothetical protein N7496_009053 [Penicillium cataractarum]
MQPHESATPMAPPSTTLRQQSQKRLLNSSPVTPSKRRRILPFPSTGSLRTPASTKISFTSTPLSTPRTRTELDRYYEDVERDARRILVVKNQLNNLQRGVDADPQSSPEATSESTPMTTKKAVKLLEKILKEDQLVKTLEGERRQIEPKTRGPKRSDKGGVVKSSRNKERTRREKLSKDIRNTRKRIGNAWARLKYAQFVTEPDTLAITTTGVFEDAMYSMSSPIGLVAVQAEAEGDSGEMADNSDSEPMLPTGRTIARSIMSPSVPPEPLQETENPNIDGDKDDTESPAENRNADTDSNKENVPVEKQMARESVSLSKSVQDRPLLFTKLKHNHRTTHTPRRSIYTPGSSDDEDRPEPKRHERTSTHTTTEATTPSVGVPADQTAEKTTSPINPNTEETQGKAPLRQSVIPLILHSTPLFNHPVFSSSEDDIIDSEEDQGSSDNYEEKGDVKLKTETDDDDCSDDEDESEYSDAKVKMETDDEDSSDDEDESEDSEAKVKMEADDDDDDDDSEDEEDDDEGGDVEVKAKVEDEESRRGSEGTREVEDNQDAEDTGNGQDMVQQKEGSVIHTPSRCTINHADI